jgi:glutathione S-transferase
MHNIVAYVPLLTVVVTILTVIVVLWTGFRVGAMRGKHKIDAPAVTGNPEFERAYRVQMNTVEQVVVFLPLLWLSLGEFHMWPLATPILGLVWVLGRIVYATGYMAAPAKRSTGFLISFVATIGLLITSIIGVVQDFNTISQIASGAS